MLFITISIKAQKIVSVKDSITHEPVTFANIYLGNKTGGYTDEKGVIEIPDGIEKIRLSHICYDTKYYSLSDDIDQSVLLVPKSVNLDGVDVRAQSPRRIKTIKIGNVGEKTQTVHRGANGFEIALFIPCDSSMTETTYIHSILASLDYSTHWLVFSVIDKPIYATLRFDLRLPDLQTGAPKDESLIDGGIILRPDDRIGKEGVKLSNPIPFPSTGVFVVVEWITTAKVSDAQNLIPSLTMTLNAKENRTWNRKTFAGMDWMSINDEPVYQDENTSELFKGRIPCAKLGLEVSR